MSTVIAVQYKHNLSFMPSLPVSQFRAFAHEAILPITSTQR
ncbi:hypothetical protein [Spirosoma soli]